MFFLKDVNSLNKLFGILELFQSCSGLKINHSISELLWPGSLRHRKDTEEITVEKNFFDKLNKLKQLLNVWSSRDILKLVLSAVS